MVTDRLRDAKQVIRWIIAKVFGNAVAYGLSRLSFNSLRQLPSQFARLWQLARCIAYGSGVPPSPIKLQVETTDICNLKCRMCAREVLEGMNTTSMGLDVFTQLISETKPFYVTLNGLGEPLIDPTIFEKLECLQSRGIRVAMPTNGMLLSGERQTKLLQYFPDFLTVSIDGATRTSFESIRKLAKFEKVIQNVKDLADARASATTHQGRLLVLCALQKDNLFDFEEMYRLIHEVLKPDDFSVVPVFDYDPNGNRYSDVIPSPEEIAELHRRIDECMTATTDQKRRQFFKTWKNVSSAWKEKSDRIEALEANNHACAIPWFSSYIDAKGRVYPCCYLIASEHVMGNINEASFRTIWHGQKYQSFRYRLSRCRRDLPGCQTCRVNNDALVTAVRKYRFLLPRFDAHGG